MREFLYISDTKLRRFEIDSRRSLGVRSITVSAGVPVVKADVKLETSNLNVLDEKFGRVKAVTQAIENSPRFARWLEDPDLHAGDWIMFECWMRFAQIHRDKGSPLKEPALNVILFRGAVGDDEGSYSRELESDWIAAEHAAAYSPTTPVSWQTTVQVPRGSTELLLTGSYKHMLDSTKLGDTSYRSGSGTDHLYLVLRSIAEADVSGEDDRLPDDFHKPVKPNVYRTGEENVRTIFNSGLWYERQPAYLSGYAQVLADLPAEDQQNRLILGTPLFVQYSDPPVPIVSNSPHRKSNRFWRWFIR
jgi:hypothetical protein